MEKKKTKKQKPPKAIEDIRQEQMEILELKNNHYRTITEIKFDRFNVGMEHTRIKKSVNFKRTTKINLKNRGEKYPGDKKKTKVSGTSRSMSEGLPIPVTRNMG
jgi:hypothetical protein